MKTIKLPSEDSVPRAFLEEKRDEYLQEITDTKSEPPKHQLARCKAAIINRLLRTGQASFHDVRVDLLHASQKENEAVPSDVRLESAWKIVTDCFARVAISAPR